MALTIGDDTITSDRSAHTAVLLPGGRFTWAVSWLPRHLDRGKAVTAMAIADATADGQLSPDSSEWARITSWPAELGLTAPKALHQVAAPPQWDWHPRSVYEFPELNGTRAVLEDPDPVDLGQSDEFIDAWGCYPGSPDWDRAADEPIDLTWTGKEPPETAPDPEPPSPGLGLRAANHSQAGSDLWLPVPTQRSTPAHALADIPRQSTYGLDDHTPRHAANPAQPGRPALPSPQPGNQHQPATEPDSEPDWEAGE